MPSDEWDVKAREIVPCPAVPDATSAERMCPFGWNSCRRAAKCDLVSDIAAFGREAYQRGRNEADTAAEMRGIERAAKWHDKQATDFEEDAKSCEADDLDARPSRRKAKFHTRCALQLRALAPPMADASPTEPAGASDREGT